MTDLNFRFANNLNYDDEINYKIISPCKSKRSYAVDPRPKTAAE